MILSGAVRRMDWSWRVEKEVRAFGFEGKECPTCVLRFTVGMSGVSKRSFDVRAFGFEGKEACPTYVTVVGGRKEYSNICVSIHSGDVRRMDGSPLIVSSKKSRRCC